MPISKPNLKPWAITLIVVGIILIVGLVTGVSIKYARSKDPVILTEEEEDNVRRQYNFILTMPYRKQDAEDFRQDYIVLYKFDPASLK